MFHRACSLIRFRLKNDAQGYLGAARVGTVRACRSRTTGAVRGDVAQRRSGQAVFIRAPTRVVLRVEYIETFECEVTGNALCERQLFGETCIKTIDAIQIQIADRLEWYARSSASAAIKRTRDQRSRERIPETAVVEFTGREDWSVMTELNCQLLIR